MVSPSEVGVQLCLVSPNRRYTTSTCYILALQTNINQPGFTFSIPLFPRNGCIRDANLVMFSVARRLPLVIKHHRTMAGGCFFFCHDDNRVGIPSSQQGLEGLAAIRMRSFELEGDQQRLPLYVQSPWLPWLSAA